MILMLQYCKLTRELNENIEEWMGYLRTTAKECGYNENDRKLKENFEKGINDGEVMTQIISDLTTVKKTDEITS